MSEREGELDLSGSSTGPADEPSPLWAPMHADNWALALASGYIGGSLKDDSAADVQTGAGIDILCFPKSVPAWAMSEGEGGPRVVLQLAPELPLEDVGGFFRIAGPVRLSHVVRACFEDHRALENFQASFELFPDIPTDLVPVAVGGYEVRQGSAPSEVGMCSSERAREKRSSLDFFAGWAAALLAILETGEFDSEIRHLLAGGGEELGALAVQSLKAIDPGASELDADIWSAAIRALRGRYGKRGFDRAEFLSEIEATIGARSGEAGAWISGCRKVINAERDIPELDDATNIGRRAVLALMLAHEPGTIGELEESLGVGPRVRSLVMQAVYAFAGLARLDASHKKPARRLEAALTVGQALETGSPVPVAVRPRSVGADLSQTEEVLVAGRLVFERTTQPPAYLLMLKARAQEAGFNVKVDQALGKLVIMARKSKTPIIVVETNNDSTPDQPVINLVLELSQVGARPATVWLKSYLELAWSRATTIGIRSVDGIETICAVASIPLATLDRDEFRFHVERLLALAEASPTKKKPRRVSRNPAKG